ncbi:MAG: putative bifunctional diguanylate cyclase/phosphodiesterase [Pseudomonadales bacterium]
MDVIEPHASVDKKKSNPGILRQTISGFYPRDAFEQQIDSILEAASVNQLEKLWVAIVKVPRLHHIRLVMGVDAADDVVRSLGNFLRAEFPDALVFGHLENDKLAVASAGPARRLSHRLEPTRDIRFIGETVEVFGHRLFIRMCAGACYYSHPDHATNLVYKTQLALSCALDGDSDLVFYTDVLGDESVQRLSLQKQLLPAIEKDELVLHYQPFFDLRSGKITGVEALVRWQHGADDLLAPQHFIPEAERTGLIVPLGDWVLRSAIRQFKRWQGAGCRPLRLAVNLSPIQVLQTNLVETIKALLRQYDLDAQWLELEITEDVMLVDIEGPLEVLTQLRNLGVKLAIDDFGSGYSSFKYLKRLPTHRLKIDQEFVREIALHHEDRAIVQTIITTAANLGMKVVAEGVETSQQAELLTQLGCQEAQGFYFSPPLDRDAMQQQLQGQQAQ